MAKNNKNIEEKVDNEVKNVVDKVTETSDNVETTETSDLTPSEIEENKEELDKLDEELDNLKNEAEKIQQEIKEEIKEDLKELEKEISQEKSEEKSVEKEPKEVSDSELEDVLKAIAVCNWFNNLNIGKHLVNKFETTKEQLKAFFDEYKSGNYLSSQEEYIVFRKLNDLFNN